jgi:hypothetical protein
MNQALYAHMNNKRKKKEIRSYKNDLKKKSQEHNIEQTNKKRRICTF